MQSPIPNMKPDVKRLVEDPNDMKELFVSVIELAIKDYKFLLRIRAQDKLTDAEKKKLRELDQDGDPEKFFASTWFEDICRMIGLAPGPIRARLDQMS